MPGESIFDRIVVHENAYTQLLRNLMERYPVFKTAMLSRLFSSQLASELATSPMETQATLSIGGSSYGKPDIFISTPRVCGIVEVKTELGCPITNRQNWLARRREEEITQEAETDGYIQYLQRQASPDRWLVFLIPGGWVQEKCLRDHIAQSGSQMGVRLKVVKWEELFSEIDESMRSEPLIGEFRLLLSKRFEPISFSQSEVDVLANSETLVAVWKLGKLINLISEKAKNERFIVQMETDVRDGSYGFYFKNGKDYLLYFGCWIPFSQKVGHSLCVGVGDDWVEGLKKRFVGSNPYETVPFVHPKPHTMSWVPEEYLTDNDAASKIWEWMQPIVRGVSGGWPTLALTTEVGAPS